jgi:DNA primase
MAARKKELLAIDGQEVAISNPDKLYFREAGISKLELVQYYLAVAEGALRGVRDRPMALKRFVDGAEGEFFFQKRARVAAGVDRRGRARVSLRVGPRSRSWCGTRRSSRGS